MTAKEFFEGKFQTINPYDNKGSYELIQAVKHGETKDVLAILDENKYLVHDFDHVIIYINLVQSNCLTLGCEKKQIRLDYCSY